MKKVVGILLKTIGYVFLTCICFLLVAFYALQLPEVQTELSNKATSILSEKLGGNISIGKVRVKWFDEVIFEDLNIKDEKDRNMIFVRELYVDAKTSFNYNFKEFISYTDTAGLKIQPGKAIKFDNSLDFVSLKNPEVNFIRDSTGWLNFDYWLANIDKFTKKPNAPKKPAKPFMIDNATISNGTIRIVSEVHPRKTDGSFDFSNFEFGNLNTRLEELWFKRDTIVFQANHLSAIDNFSKLNLKKISGHFYHTKKGIKLDNLDANLNDSRLTNKLHFLYNRPGDFGDFFNKVRLDADLRNSNLQSKDIGLFITFMRQFDENYKFNAKLSGPIVNLNIKDLLLTFGQGSKIVGDAQTKGLPDLLKVHSTINLKPSKLLEKDIAQYSDNVQFQKYIKKMGELDISGQFVGVYNDFQSKPKLYSPKLGSIEGIVNVTAQEKLKYFGNLNIKKLKVGEILDQTQLNEITFSGKIDGSGRKLDEAKVHLDGYVSEIDFRGYRYKNIDVNGDLSQSLFEGKLDIEDQNIIANLEGRVDFNKPINAFNFVGDVKHANLFVLGFTNKEFLLKTKLDFNFEGNKLDDWLGEASFGQFEMKENGKVLQADSLYFFSSLRDKARHFKVKTEFIDADILGNFVPSRLIKDFTALVKEHLMYFKNSEQERSDYYLSKKEDFEPLQEDYRINYSFRFNNSKPFFEFFAPQAYAAQNTRITGNYTSGNNSLFNLSASTDTLTLKGNHFYSTVLDYNVQKEVLTSKIINKVRIKSDKQSVGNDTKTEELVVNANWEGSNTIDFRTFVTQQTSNSLIDLRGQLDFNQEGFQVKILPDLTRLKLIDLDWCFDEENQISVQKKHISFKDFNISGDNDQKIGLNGVVSENMKDEVQLDVKDFNIENLLPFINVDLKGIATGNLRLRNFFENPIYLTNVKVDNFYYKKSLIGDVVSSGIWDDQNERLRIRANVLRKNVNILNVTGHFTPKLKNQGLNLLGKVRDLDLDMFMGMTGDVFSHISGFANGDIKISGGPRKPIFNGDVQISKGSVKVAVSGTEVFFEDKLTLTERGFELPEKGVELRDSPHGNIAQLKGGVYYKKGPGFDVDLRANTEGKTFKMMDIGTFQNDYIFGTAYAVGDLALSGDFDNLLITGNLTSKEGTKVTIPTDGDTKVDTEQAGIAFIKKSPLVDSTTLNLKRRSPLVKTGGIRMAFNLTLTPEAEGDVIFDRNNNDILHLYGDGKLAVLFDSRGEFRINGPYNLKGGKYYFSFQNLASLRRFDISDKSKIVFNGDPFEAILDIKATYTANISINKLSRQMANSTARFPVFVQVFLTDRLLTPTIKYDISFDLKQVPISGQTDLLAFEQRLNNDEQLLSRNVSSILVFNEVFPDNNMSEGLTNQFIIDNISSLLSNQIGNLANKLNPNLEFGVRFGDFRENLLNNMQLDFSYKFLNNRVRLSGKGAFINSLENNISMNANTYGQFSVGGELEYLISDDGAYRFKLYSRSVPTNYYVFYSQGNVVVSGGSLIISRNFNSFFKRKEEIQIGVGTSQSDSTKDIK